MIGLAFKLMPTTSPIDVTTFAEWAKIKHGTQVRRDKSPYFGHCCNVAAYAKSLAKQFGASAIELTVVECAGYGHDLIEDTQTDFEDIVKMANEETAAIVSWLSDDKRIPAEIRHVQYVDRLRQAPLWAQVVKLSDLHDNSTDSLALLEPSRIKFLRKWRSRASEQLAALELVRTSSLYEKVGQTLMDLSDRIERLNDGVD